MKEEKKKSPASDETGLPNFINLESNLDELGNLLRLASKEVSELTLTLNKLNRFKLKYKIK